MIYTFVMSPKILFVKLGALGDLSFALPSAELFKKVYPQGHFTWAVGQSVQSYLQGRPEIDRLVIVDDKNLFSSNPLRRVQACRDFIARLEPAYDLLVIAHRNLAYSLLLKSFVKGPIFQLAREEHPFLEKFGIHSIIATPLETHESVGIGNTLLAAMRSLKPTSPLPLWNGKIQRAQGFSAGKSPIVSNLPSDYLVLQMGGAGNLKTEFRLKSWAHWKDLVKLLLEKTEQNLVFIGAPNEKTEIEEILSQFPTNSRIHNLTGKTNFHELEHILSQAKGVVGIDSGPLHIADALRVPTLGIFGPSSTKSWGFLGERSQALKHSVPCSPCYKDDGIFPECAYQHRCMTGLKPEVVLEQIVKNFTKNT
ncbi:MAG: glycosyltransferase family 9 protein [Bdellovibrionales bacterium]